MALFGGQDSSLTIVLKAKDQASPEFEKAAKKIQRTADELVSIGKKMTLGVTLPFVAAAAGAVKAASDWEETQNKFEAVFGDLKKDAEDFSRAISEAVGRNETDVKSGLSAFQSFAVGMGFTKDKAFEMASSLQTLSLDFASFNNLSDGEAQQRFISAMSGSSEVLDMFGINIKQSALDLKLQALGLAESTLKATEMEKATARLAIIMESMTDQGAVGDAVRTSESFANQSKRLMGELKSLGEVMGRDLLPMATKLVKVAIELVGWFGDLDETWRGVLFTIGGTGAVMGPAIIVAGQFAKAIVAIRAASLGANTSLITLRTTLLATVGPIGVVAGALGVLAKLTTDWLTMPYDQAIKNNEEMAAVYELNRQRLIAAREPAEEFAESLSDISDEAKKTAKELEKVTEDIEQLEDRITDTIKDNAKKQQGYKEDLAQTFIEQEEKVKSITEDIGAAQIKNKEAVADMELRILEEKDARRRLELENELAKIKETGEQEIEALQQKLITERTALEQNKQLRTDIQAELTEMYRRSQLTEFELKVENLMRQRVEDLRAFSEKLALQVQELAALKAQKSAIMSVERQHTNQLAAEEDKRAEKVEQTTARIKSSLQFRTSALSTGSSGFVNPNADFFGKMSQSTPAFLPGRAAGGPVESGKPYLVGEQGPELFLPRSSGNIVPNGGMGGITVNIYNPSVRNDSDLADMRRQINAAFRDLAINYKLNHA